MVPSHNSHHHGANLPKPVPMYSQEPKTIHRMHQMPSVHNGKEPSPSYNRIPTSSHSACKPSDHRFGKDGSHLHYKSIHVHNLDSLSIFHKDLNRCKTGQRLHPGQVVSKVPRYPDNY